jgi:hypothetical protein
MKKLIVAAAVLAAMTMLSACQQNKIPAAQPGIHDTKMADGLSVTVDTPQRNVVRGQSLQVTVTAKNTSDKPIEIVAANGAPVIVTLARKTSAGWETVKTFPENATQVTQKWTLQPKAERKFPLTLPLSADLPTGEPLRLTAKVNGRPDVAPGGFVQIYMDVSACNRAGVYVGEY